MNTPKYSTNHINENKPQDIDRLQTRLVQNQIRQIQGRDYGRILRESNTPAQWYQASPRTRSIYYYDPHYQKYLQQLSSKPSTNIRVRKNPHLIYFFSHIFSFQLISSPHQVPNQSHSCTKCTSSFHNHQQKSILPSRLQSVPRLPPIIMHKKPNDE